MDFVYRFLLFGLIAGVITAYIPDFSFFFEIGFIQTIIGFIKSVIFVISVAAIGALVYPILNAPKPKIPEFKDEWFGKTDAKNAQQDDKTINKFEVNVAEEVLEDLRRRLDSARFVEPIPETKFNYGFNADYLKQVVEYWKNGFDWRKQESELNQLNQYTTQIQGLNIHFIHVKPSKPAKTVVSLMVVHGWPGSVWEYYKSIPLLLEPTNDIAFEVICPSIPGFGFSEAPHKQGFNTIITARIFAKLMERLGHKKYFVHGGDWGSYVTRNMAKLYPQNVQGIHTTMPQSITSLRGIPLLKYIFGAYFPSLVLENPDSDYKKIYPIWEKFSFLMRESGYFHIQATKPDTVGAALVDSPVGLAAYILEKFSTATNPNNVRKPNGGLTENFTLDELLTNVMIYWVSNNVASSMRFYKENLGNPIGKFPVTIPAAACDSPYEITRFTKSMSKQEYPNLIQYTEMPRGGHFAALENPELLTDDIRSFVKKVLNNK